MAAAALVSRSSGASGASPGNKEDAARPRGRKVRRSTGDGGEAWASRQRLQCSVFSPVGLEGRAER